MLAPRPVAKLLLVDDPSWHLARMHVDRVVAGLALSGLIACAAGCGLLKKKDVGADADAAVEAALATAASTEPEPSASASAAPEVKIEDLKLPGACVNALADANKRSPFGATEGEVTDLDGDGKNDKIFNASAQNHLFSWLYVMRGSCGYFVGETGPTDGYKVTSNKSHGLRSLDLTAGGTDCTDDCGCKTTSTPFYFDGKKYVEGKTKEVIDKPCKDAGVAAAKDAGAPATAGFKVGDKLTVEWKGKNYPAQVIQVAGPDKYKIHYDGYGPEWDEVVGPSRIKGKR